MNLCFAWLQMTRRVCFTFYYFLHLEIISCCTAECALKRRKLWEYQLGFRGASIPCYLRAVLHWGELFPHKSSSRPAFSRSLVSVSNWIPCAECTVIDGSNEFKHTCTHTHSGWILNVSPARHIRSSTLIWLSLSKLYTPPLSLKRVYTCTPPHTCTRACVHYSHLHCRHMFLTGVTIINFSISVTPPPPPSLFTCVLTSSSSRGVWALVFCSSSSWCFQSWWLTGKSQSSRSWTKGPELWNTS